MQSFLGLGGLVSLLWKRLSGARAYRGGVNQEGKLHIPHSCRSDILVCYVACLSNQEQFSPLFSCHETQVHTRTTPATKAPPATLASTATMGSNPAFQPTFLEKLDLIPAHLSLSESVERR